MVPRGFKSFAYFLSLSLYAKHTLARVSNITFSGTPSTCSTVTISWKGGVPPYTVTVLRVDPRFQPALGGTITGIPVQVSETGNAQRVVWTAAVGPGDVLVAVVGDGLEQTASSAKTVVQASRNVNCLAAVTPTDTSTFSIALPSLTIRPIGSSTVITSSAIMNTFESINPSETPLSTNPNHSIALPVLLTLFTIGIVAGILVYGFCIYRSCARKRSNEHPYDDAEQGRYGDTTTASLRILGTYSRQLGREINRKISALSSQISRRPTAVVATEKPESFTILPEETSPPVSQEMSQPPRADVVDPRAIIGVPIMPVHAITASRPTSGVTVSTVSWTMETGTGLGPPRPVTTSKDEGLRPAPPKSKKPGQGRPLPKPPALHLGRLETRRQYGLPTGGNRLEAMRPMSRSKSADVVEPKHKSVSSLPSMRRSVSAGAGMDSPPAHLAQVPISALPPATPFSSNIRHYSRISGYLSPEPGAMEKCASSRKRSNTIGSIVVVQEVPFVIESPAIPCFNQSVDTSGTTPLTNVPGRLDIIFSSRGSDEGDHIDPFFDIPHTPTTARTRYSMALPDSGSLLPASFSAAQDEVVPPLPYTPKPLPMTARTPTSPTAGATR